ncbi:MAG TPA: hypothetical protein VM554_12170 [Acidisarcina sp.]|nr:hypothetical protein [Acidisarcina sp.]
MALRMGAEDKKKVAIAGVLGVIVLILGGRTLMDTFSTPAPAPVPPAVVTTQQAPANAGGTGGSTVSPGHPATKLASTNLDPTLHPEWMAATESMTYSGTGRNIFSQLSAPAAIEKPKASARPVKVVNAGPPPPPPPPPIDLKFFGFSATKSGLHKAFLLHGEDVFIAAEGDVVDRRYRVVKILPFSVQVEDLPYRNTQTLPLLKN